LVEAKSETCRDYFAPGAIKWDEALVSVTVYLSSMPLCFSSLKKAARLKIGA
jgi:hypothetical protein